MHTLIFVYQWSFQILLSIIPTPLCKNKVTKTKNLIIFRVQEFFSSDTDAAAGAAATAAATAAASAAAIVATTVKTMVKIATMVTKGQQQKQQQ